MNQFHPSANMQRTNWVSNIARTDEMKFTIQKSNHHPSIKWRDYLNFREVLNREIQTDIE
jgi:hypothetical protein